jgi:glycosyltransferase involved in cell wall biosynthesis
MAPGPPAPIRVLAVDHTAGVVSFRKKFEALAAADDLELTVLAPERWIENYRLVEAAAGVASGYRIETGRVGWPGYENRAFFRSGLGSLIRRSQPDILHLWEEPFSLIALQALWQARIWAPRSRAIFFSSDNLSRDFRYSYRPSWFYARVERFAHRRCVGGMAVSEEVAAVLRAKGFSKPLLVVPHGLDPADYFDRDRGAIGAGTEGRARALFGLEGPVVGFVGRLLRQKGVDLMLRAVATLPEPRPAVVVMGDGPERSALEALAGELGLTPNIRFLSVVPHGGVASVLAAVDVLVVPSRTTPLWKEQFGRVLVEGMAAGCAVIGSSSGSIPEVLGDAGLVFAEDDVEDLARSIRRALEEPGLVTALQARGRERVLERYTWDVIARRIAAFYRRLLSAPAEA